MFFRICWPLGRARAVLLAVIVKNGAHGRVLTGSGWLIWIWDGLKSGLWSGGSSARLELLVGIQGTGIEPGVLCVRADGVDRFHRAWAAINAVRTNQTGQMTKGDSE